MNVRNKIIVDPKISHVENLIKEIEMGLCDGKIYNNPAHASSNDIRDYLIKRELFYLYRHSKHK